MSHLVTITGATGHTGRPLVQRLLQSGVAVRAVGRSAQRLAPLAAAGADVCVGDMQNAAFLAEVFRGAEAAFAMIPTHVDASDFGADQRRTIACLAEGLENSGVRHVVALSSTGAVLSQGTGPIAYLHEFEQRLKLIPHLSVLVLRASFFMENFLASIPLIKNAGINGGPLRADVSIPMIATRDIAVIAADYLATRKFDGYAVRALLGARNYSHREATSILGAAIGRPDLAYVEFSYGKSHTGLLEAGFSTSAANCLVEMYSALNEGRVPAPTDRDAATTTPTTLEEFACEVFKPAYQAS